MDEEEKINEGFNRRQKKADVELLSRKGQRFKTTALRPGDAKDLVIMFEDGYKTSIPDNVI